jgi:hypothetical protein
MMAWSLSREERLELRELFEGLDVHHTGTINIQTLKEVLREKFRIDSTEAEALFQTLDADHDHEIAYTEFLAPHCRAEFGFMRVCSARPSTVLTQTRLAQFLSRTSIRSLARLLKVLKWKSS